MSSSSNDDLKISSKVLVPSEFFINFYYWYSNITLALTWILAPLVFYVILTQSKNLKSFKWLILNHTFWCFAFETIFAIVKPFFLVPAAAGFPISLLQDGSFFMTAIAILIILSLAINCFTSLIATLLSRYLLVFPSSLEKYFSLKSFIWFTIFLTLFFYLCLAGAFTMILQMDEKIIRQWAMESDPVLEKYKDIPGFFYTPYKSVEIPLLFVMILLGCSACGAIILSLYFVFLVKTQQSLTIAKLQRSLIVSCIIQIWSFFIFLFTPIAILMGSMYFQIPSTTNIVCLACCCLNSHAFVEFITTLYFVLSYRTFVTTLLLKLLFVLKHILKRSRSNVTFNSAANGIISEQQIPN